MMSLKRIKKRIDIKVLTVAVLAAIFVPLVLTGAIDFQSTFDLEGNRATFRIAGVGYEGVDYLSKAGFTDVGADVYLWKDNEFSFDPDGEIIRPEPMDYAKEEPNYIIDEYGGLQPAVKFKISDSLSLVDESGDPLAFGCTYKTETIEGYNMYVYHYKTDVTISLDIGVADGAPLTEWTVGYDKLPAYTTKGIRGHVFTYNGVPYGVMGMAEIGVINNLYTLLAIDFPEMDNWEFSWEADVNNVGAVFNPTQNAVDGTFTEYTWESYVDSFDERASALYYDFAFHINENEPIQRSHSVNDRITLENIGGQLVGPIGAEQIQAYGAYDSYYTSYFYTGLNCTWNMLEPTITYGITLQVSAVDTYVADDNGGGGGGGDDPDPDPPFDWREYFSTMSTRDAAIIGGALFAGILGIAFVMKRPGGMGMGGGSYY